MADSDISAATRATCEGEEFKESISRFRKALLRTVVYKRDHRKASEDYDQSQLNSSTVDFPSSQQALENGDWEDPLDPEVCSEHQLLPLELTKEDVLKSPIQTTPRNGLRSTICPKCSHFQQALATARLQIKQQDSKIAELNKQLSSSQQLNSTREAETKALQVKLDGLFAQHLQVLADYKTLASTCQVLERQHSMLQKSFSDAENWGETVQKRTKARLKTPLRARPLDERSNCEFSGERKVRKCPSLSQTTISRRSESLKTGSQDRHSRLHSPLGRAHISPRASPGLRKRRESAGKVFLTSVRQRIGSSVLGVEGMTKTPKKVIQGL